MTVSFGDRKLRLIQEIMSLNNEQSLSKLEQQIQSLKDPESKSEKFWDAIRPIKKSISIAEMIKNQGYKPIKKNSFYNKVSKLEITESLEELLLMLSK